MLPCIIKDNNNRETCIVIDDKELSLAEFAHSRSQFSRRVNGRAQIT